MSTITSPRPTNPSPSLTSTPTTSRTTSPAPQPRRANRTALRDYYNLTTTTNTTTTTTPAAPGPSTNTPRVPSPPPTTPKTSELDAPAFDAEAYVKAVLAGQGLEGVLRVEGGLISEIKGLDGERKALVYDNYSKLIVATDTIRRMRLNMDPLTARGGMLSPAVGYIAEVAGGLVDRAMVGEGEMGEREEGKRRRERDTVRWVLGTPRRLGGLLDEGRRGDAEKEWEEVRGLLERWKGVSGVEELKDECERVMGRS
ncbi:hypothetical protein N7G274_002191 [Stereocaulon virgatum]|uniref:Vacuolar protein sorting-associated protein 51 homolog n=1 Tax=Stereocaulon virgatum TaxID=373712 RepID=A0ABR4AJX9_9LECA